MLVVHSNPLTEPGSGDAGGMTVYVREVAAALARKGLEVDIYTRRDSSGTPDITELRPGVRVIQVEAGPYDLPKESLADYLPAFACAVASHAQDLGPYDIIHSHYWLSGRVAAKLSDRWGAPFLHTFHTLGRVKNDLLRPGDLPEPEGRLLGEGRVISEAEAIVASTPEERASLIELYAAHPERIHLVSPGVDHDLFTPGDSEAAKATLGLSGRQVILFVGRLQPLKAPDTALRALAHLVEWGRVTADDAKLLIVGGSSGVSGAEEPARLAALAQSLGIADLVSFIPAQRQRDLPIYYHAADVCIVPSHTESFGLVALEAQACGVPVVASAVGGLRSIVRHGRTGFLVEPGMTMSFAERIHRILSDPPLAASMSRLALCASADFSWERAASELRDLYRGSLQPEQELSLVRE